MDRTDLYAVLDHFELGGMLYTLAEAIAKAQQDLEHSTEWEVERTGGDDGSPDGAGWVPFAADRDADIYWRRPRPNAT